MATIDRLVIATGNPHKVDEMREILGRLLPRITIVGLNDLPQRPAHGWPEPTETGATFVDNASIKALAYARLTGEVCLADDSGLEIDALHGRPGVISSHYCTDGSETGMTRGDRDSANNERVMRELAGVALPRRTARFVCVMSLATPTSAVPIAVARGTFEGRIGLPAPAPNAVPRGSHGFGYDPIFLLPAPDQRSSAELTPREKNACSHRGVAARAMAELIRQQGIAGTG
jgi:XTP/dITP diphosphohydrolase